MGYACAQAAVMRGHEVILVSGPVGIKRPKGVKFIPVVSAADMAKEVFHIYGQVDCVVMTAAVADYTPASSSKHKIVKMPGDLNIKMKRTTDILAELGKRKNKQKLIGFAVQDNDAKTNARRKLKEKNLDAIIMNAPSAMGSKRNTISILKGDNIGQWVTISDKTKVFLGKAVIQLAEDIAKFSG